MADIDNDEAKTKGIGLGLEAAEAIIVNRTNDGIANTRYMPVNSMPGGTGSKYGRGKSYQSFARF